MKGLIIGLVVAVNFVLESTFFQYISVFGIKPDVALVIITTVAILQGKDMGIVTGVASGMLQDIIFGKPIGISAFSYMVAGYVVGLNSEKIFKENLIVPVIFTTAATLIKYAVTVFYLYAIQLNFSLLSYIRSTVLPEAVYNCIISVFIYKGLHILFHKKFVQEGFSIKRSR